MFWAIDRSSRMPSPLRSSGTRKMPLRAASAEFRIDSRAAVEADRTAEDRVDAEDGAREFGAAGADQAGQAQDFAAVEVES